MITITDIIAGTEQSATIAKWDVADTLKTEEWFGTDNAEVVEVIDALQTAINTSSYTGGWETYLGIEIG